METLKDIFVSYEIVQKLKEIGFDEPCLFYYSWENKMYCLIPNRTDQMRVIDITEIDNHNANESEDSFCSAPTYEQVFKWFRKMGKYRTITENFFETYEQCRESLINMTIKTIKYEQTNKI